MNWMIYPAAKAFIRACTFLFGAGVTATVLIHLFGIVASLEHLAHHGEIVCFIGLKTDLETAVLPPCSPFPYPMN